MQTRQEDEGHRVDASWWARGHQVGSTDPTLLCLGCKDENGQKRSKNS